jgi:3-oxo-5-alpha-steroid 4-dehydrogenase 1
MSPSIVWAWTALAVPVFLALLFIEAPYGRHARGGYGPVIPARIAWIAMESPAVVGMIALFVAARPHGAVAPAFLALWLLHYGNRALVYPLRLGGATPMPLGVVAMGFGFNAVNAWLQGSVFRAGYADTWLLDPRFLIGAALFLAGWALNQHADAVLRRLRRGGYQIPRGGLYRFVSCPNYLGELIEWIGWAIATWSLVGVSFAVWTAANLVPRALANHRWLRARFPDYPPERRAILPYIV